MSQHQPDAVLEYGGKASLIDPQTEVATDWLTVNHPNARRLGQKWAFEEYELQQIVRDMEAAGLVVEIHQLGPTY